MGTGAKIGEFTMFESDILRKEESGKKNTQGLTIPDLYNMLWLSAVLSIRSSFNRKLPPAVVASRPKSQKKAFGKRAHRTRTLLWIVPFQIILRGTF
jgi:hypothetical protein